MFLSRFQCTETSAALKNKQSMENMFEWKKLSLQPPAYHTAYMGVKWDIMGGTTEQLLRGADEGCMRLWSAVERSSFDSLPSLLQGPREEVTTECACCRVYCCGGIIHCGHPSSVTLPGRPWLLTVHCSTSLACPT